MSLYKTSRSDVVDHLHSTKYVKTKKTRTNYIGSVVNYKISAGGRMDGGAIELANALQRNPCG